MALMPLFLSGCGPNPSPASPSSMVLGSPVSRFCAADNPCPGITKTKLKVCGECDPSTRYFRRAICSLDEKLRKAVDSCVRTKVGLHISGKALFGTTVEACVKQRLVNEPTVLKSFIAVARGHQAKQEEQKAWRSNCESRWAEYIKTHPNALDVRPPPPPIATRPFYKKWWFWTAVGVIATGTGAAIIVGTRRDGVPLGQYEWNSFSVRSRR